MNIHDLVRSKVIQAIERCAEKENWPGFAPGAMPGKPTLTTTSVNVEVPTDSLHGDLSTNAAMVLAPQLKQKPQAIAVLLKQQLDTDHMFSNISFAGPGFINFVLKPHFWQRELPKIITEGDTYARSNLGEGKHVNIEYASPNPTGPMHIGHARGAVYGDVLASLLQYVGYKVVRECYINDAGNQMDIVANSIYHRYQETCGIQMPALPEGCYPSQYIIEAAIKLKSEHGAALLEMPEAQRHSIVRTFAITEMLALIKSDLAAMDVHQEVFFYESSLHTEGRLAKLVAKLEAEGLAYYGALEAPKGMPKHPEAEGADGQTMLLFKSTSFGDDMDRVLQKSNGTWTYFAADSAYLADKISRHFDELVLVLGADHVGYKKRVQAMCSALNGGKCILDVKLCQLVSYLQDGKPLKMSKRAGTFVSIDQVIEMVGKDILRFMMLVRKNDVTMDFDVSKVQEQSKDNPVFYVQYAHARGCSVLANAAESAPEAFKFAQEHWDKTKLELLSGEPELELIRFLCSWPRQVATAALSHDPSRLVWYLQTLAGKFHAFWNLGKESSDLRFIIEGNTELTAARLVMVMATLRVISSGLRLVGVEPVNKM